MIADGEAGRVNAYSRFAFLNRKSLVRGGERGTGDGGDGALLCFLQEGGLPTPARGSKTRQSKEKEEEKGVG